VASRSVRRLRQDERPSHGSCGAYRRLDAWFAQDTLPFHRCTLGAGHYPPHLCWCGWRFQTAGEELAQESTERDWQDMLAWGYVPA
jgi:hypothetical protein